LNYTDIHAHLADPRILPLAADILEESRSRGVRGILANAARVGEWPDIVRLTANPLVYGALGLHPFFVEEWYDGLIGDLRRALRAEPRCVAIGEIGLDFYRGRTDAARQMEAFTTQLALARELNLPVILHNRKAWPEFFDVLRQAGLPARGGVCHHFSASIEIARQALDAGLYLSFCGPLTYPNARRLKAVAAYAPLDRVLTETDTPDLPPERYRGQESRPFHVQDVVRELATLRGTTEPAVAQQVETNFLAVVGDGVEWWRGKG